MMCEFMHVHIVCKCAYLQDIQINKVYTILIPKTKMLNLEIEHCYKKYQNKEQ